MARTQGNKEEKGRNIYIDLCWFGHSGKDYGMVATSFGPSNTLVKL
jgi:hypothetical protein